MANGHGGARQRAGRKTKEDEGKLIERLSPMDDLWIEKVQQGMEEGDSTILKLFASYRWGQPKQTIDTNLSGGLETFKPTWLNHEVITITNGQLKES